MSESTLRGKRVVVLGASRGLGAEIVRRVRDEGAAEVLAVARGREPLERLVRELPGVHTLALDATIEEAPQLVFEAVLPDVLVISDSPKRISPHEGLI